MQGSSVERVVSAFRAGSAAPDSVARMVAMKLPWVPTR